MVWSSGGGLCSETAKRMQFLGAVDFKSSTLTVLCLSSLFVHQKRKTYSNLAVPCWLSHLSWFQGPKYIPPFIWSRVSNHDIKSEMSKNWFLRSLLFYTTFLCCWEVEVKTKSICEVHTKILVCTTWRINISKKSTRSSEVWNFGKNFQCWKHLGMFPSSRFWDTIVFNSVEHLCLPPCVLQGKRHRNIKRRRNIWSKNHDDGKENIFFCLKVWLFGGWAETS